MDKKTIEELKRLPPKERLEKIKELKKKSEEERKKQEEEMETAVNESVKEIELDKMLQEIEVPKAEKIEVGDLFSKDADIEEKIKSENIRIEQQGGGTDYGARLDQMLPHQRVQEWYRQDANITEEEFFDLYDQVKAEYEERKTEPAGAGGQYKTQSEASADNIVASLKVLKDMGYKREFI